MSNEKSLTLGDLNDDPNLIDTATDKQILKLHKEAEEDPYFPLAGPTRYLLSARANGIKEASESKDSKEDS